MTRESDSAFVRHAKKSDRLRYSVLLDQFQKEHEEYEGDEATGEEMDEKELDKMTWADDQIKLGEKQFYPFICLSVNEKQVLGIALVAHDATKWSILEFYVDPKFRGVGIGRCLCTYVINFCRDANRDEQKSMVCIETASHVKNSGAQAFWNRMGFITVAEKVRFTDRSLYGVGAYNCHVLKPTLY